MESKSDNKIRIALIAYIAVLIVHAVDIFLIRSQHTIFGDIIFARIAGIIITFLAAKKLSFNLKSRCLNTFGMLFEILYGIGFSALALALVYGVELIYFKIKGFYAEAELFWVPPDSEGRNILTLVAAYVFALLLNVFFRELFRAFLLNQFCKRYGVKKTNCIQALLMTFLFGLSVLGMAVNGELDGRSSIDVFITIAASMLAIFVSSVKRGCFYRVNGSIWMAVADNFVYSLVITCVYFSPDRLPAKWLLVKCLVVQIVSGIIFIPFYYRRERVNEEYVKEIRTRNDVLNSMKESKEADDNSDDHSEEYLMMMNEKNQNKKFFGTKENEISDFDGETQELSADFYKGFVDRSIKPEHNSIRQADVKTSGSVENNFEDTSTADDKEMLDFTKDPHSYSEDFFKDFMAKPSRSRHNSQKIDAENSSEIVEKASSDTEKNTESDNNDELVDFNNDPHSYSEDFFKGYMNKPHKSRHRSEKSSSRASSKTASGTHTESASKLTNEILDFDKDPQSFSNAFFRSYVEKSHKVETKAKKSAKKHHSRTAEDVPNNVDNISKLADEYFKKQFDKHTYSK